MIDDIYPKHTGNKPTNFTFSHLPVFSKRLCTVHFDLLLPGYEQIPEQVWRLVADTSTHQTELCGIIKPVEQKLASNEFTIDEVVENNLHLDMPPSPPLTPAIAQTATAVIQKPFIPASPNICNPILTPDTSPDHNDQHPLIVTRVIETRTRLAKEAFIGDNMHVLLMIRQLTGAKIVYTKSNEAVMNGKSMTKVVVSGLEDQVGNATRLLLDLIHP